jgi:hypothetical protein
LEAAAAGTGVRVALIRRPGQHADRRDGIGPRQVYVAHTAPDRAWVRGAVTDEPGQLLDLDFPALGAGDHRSFDEALGGTDHCGDPLVLVCTNGKRDRCCALLGRPLAAELTAGGEQGTWEVTHLGGHRFSPTLLVLPYGYAYGRIDASAVKEVLTAVREGRIVTESCRGSSAWERPGQAAELAVRSTVGDDRADAVLVVRVEGAAPRWAVTVAHRDGRQWRVLVVQGASLPPRPESCGGALGSPARMDVVAVTALGSPGGADVEAAVEAAVPA